MSVPGGSSDGFSVELDTEHFSRLLHDVRDFDKTLYASFRKELRGVGESAVQAIRDRIESAPAHIERGLRRGLAAGTKVSISASARSGGITIRTTGSKLSAGQQAMVRAFNKPSFRRPVFAQADRPRVWVSQTGRPYFGVTLDEKRGEMQRGAKLAMDRAAAKIYGAEVVT